MVLVATSLAAAHLVLPISLAVAALLVIVVLSYTQVVRAYRTSGGAYVVAKDNLGRGAGLLAGAALLVDYVLTVAVSISARVFALTSAAPRLAPFGLEIALAFVAAIMLVNLRGTREAGLTFALPTYGFIVVLFLTLAVGLGRELAGGLPHAVVPGAAPAGAGAVGIVVVLRAFASGSSALTGVEAIANGVGAFRHPQPRNAAITLLVMGGIAASLFVGVSYLAVAVKARPSSSVSVLSEITRAVFSGTGTFTWAFYAVQAFTLAILVLAANTSFQGLPRLAALMARDGFLPHQFANLGDRLVLSNGILAVAGAAALLLVAFRANPNELIHLYVIGVFTAFTLTQIGMVRRWRRTRGPRWRAGLLLNAIGGGATALVTVLVVGTKFTQGAWMVVVAIPVLIAAFLLVRRRYDRVGRELAAGVPAVLARPEIRSEVVVYLERLDASAREALSYARAIAGPSYRAVHVPYRGSDASITERFASEGESEHPLEVLPATGGAVDAVRAHVDRLRRSAQADIVTLVIPELYRTPSLLSALVRWPSLSLRLHLLGERGVVVTDVPAGDAEAPSLLRDPPRATVIVPFAAVDGSSLAALRYARSLRLGEPRGLHVALDAAGARTVEAAWRHYGIQEALDIVEAPYRDLAGPLLSSIRSITADRNAIAVVVTPEIETGRRDRLLHNGRSLYARRLLLSEPRVILASVPYEV